MGLLSKIFSNTRKPEGFWGKMMVAGVDYSEVSVAKSRKVNADAIGQGRQITA